MNLGMYIRIVKKQDSFLIIEFISLSSALGSEWVDECVSELVSELVSPM